ncbi:stage III sporulation protein AF [Anaerocolumna sp. AGMB13020]|uniref:stage III sporulation protein AF n=1 Tax=Anaerocolumna sp. AGMB13020 TaxID=3081750 RepID=UPI00295404E4|nr:stage III sporulation protein AF [Anaerocolumna sp. AGMB13020]WOO36186.1 stage III sporulation protein AF [Anaerocolumna sp. AGMB13020]
MDYIYSWIKDIVIFMVLISVITNLMGKSSYKKYINLISGIILVILVITPLLKIFQLDNTLDYYFTTNSLTAQAGEVQDINEKFGEIESSRQEEILTQVKAKITDKINELLDKEDVETESIEIILEEDAASSSYGSLKGLNVKGVYKSAVNKAKDKETIKIDRVEINEIDLKKDNSSTEAVMDFISPVEIKAKKVLSDFYNLDADNINISIRE